ncbi:protein containing DUF1814 [sediment metagenome]|uniref:Protein containing DUF1814 n=1 Tax=sediment metagenome TaxID=749907 RepID=D9PJW5_9ZZZZ
MNDVVSVMLSKYSCKSIEDYENALKEIIQEIALLGLWRAKFFEKAAFYGGTALRIFYGMDRFSEDLDFSLLAPDKKFDLRKYCAGIKEELEGFGFKTEVQKKDKSFTSAIESAFIKTKTIENLIMIKTPDYIVKRVPSNRVIKIKMEVDIDPPGGFETEAKYLLQPIPFSVLVYKPPDLFAGKIHAILYRSWKLRAKGRDWYDLVWYVARQIPLSLSHLKERMTKAGQLKVGVPFNKDTIIELLMKRIDEVDFKAAKDDILPMIKDPSVINIWSRDFFKDVVSRIKF